MTGQSLHPGLQLAPAVPAVARSEGLAEAFSAGSHPKPAHPHAALMLRERGISFGDRRSKHLNTFAAARFDYVITLCDQVREVCLEFPGHPGHLHWSIPDPAASGGDDQAALPAFRRVAAELDTRIGYLLAGIGARPGRAA